MSTSIDYQYPNDRDGDDDLYSEEEEEERLLSAEYGEASEDGINARKRPSQSFAKTPQSAADAEAAKEFAEKVRPKKIRPTLQAQDLKGPKGLVFVRRSFSTKCKFRASPAANKVLGTGIRSSKLAQKMNQDAEMSMAANYSHSLMTAYRSFAREIFPALAPEDVFLKIEELGSKKEVRDFLQVMRDEVRKDYLEKIYGIEKTQRILHELEYGLKQQNIRPRFEEDDETNLINLRQGYTVPGHEVETNTESTKQNAEDHGTRKNPYKKIPETDVEFRVGGNGQDNNSNIVEEELVSTLNMPQVTSDEHVQKESVDVEENDIELETVLNMSRLPIEAPTETFSNLQCDNQESRTMNEVHENNVASSDAL